VVSVYPAILTTHVRLLEQRSQAVTSTERLLSSYISDLHGNAVALTEPANSCSEWGLVCALYMPPSLEALVKGDYSKLCEVGLEEECDLFAEGEEDDGACCILTGHSHQLMHTIETILMSRALEDISNDDDTPASFQHSTFDTVLLPSCVHLPQPTLDAALMPPLLSIASPEPLWLPYFRACLDKLILGLVTSAFQLLWQPSDGVSIIKQADLIPHRQLGDDHRHKIHILQRLVAIIFQEYTLLCNSPVGSYESATRDGALISQGRR
jgi:hypothetical protein